MKQYIFSILFLFFTIVSYSQQNVEFEKQNWPNDKDGWKEAKNNLKEGYGLYELDTYGGYMRAIEFLLKANNFNPNNALLNYKIGKSYL